MDPRELLFMERAMNAQELLECRRIELMKQLDNSDDKDEIQAELDEVKSHLEHINNILLSL